MCGIVGYFDRTSIVEGPLGSTILKMLEALACRGPDSAGVALFGKPSPGTFFTRVKVAEHAERIAREAELFGASDLTRQGAYLRCAIRDTGNLPAFLAAVEAVDHEVEVVSIGHRLEIVKQTGSPDNLESTYHVSRLKGTHGVGHTRLSTESRVDLSHSQPFWSHGYPDLAIVHNGHITNYHQLRRRYEQRGVRFYTENDSEVVAIYLAEQLKRRGSRGSLQRMLRDLDGSYSCLAATERQLGFVKDTFALKPLVYDRDGRFRGGRHRRNRDPLGDCRASTRSARRRSGKCGYGRDKLRRRARRARSMRRSGALIAAGDADIVVKNPMRGIISASLSRSRSNPHSRAASDIIAPA